MYIKRMFPAFLTAVSFLMFASCSIKSLPESSAAVSADKPAEEIQATEAPEVTETQTEVVLYPAALDIATNKSITLAVDNSGNQAVEWSSSNPSAVTVDSSGTVTALSIGESIISVSSGGSSDECRVTVTEYGDTLAYVNDPGPVGPDGTHQPSADQPDNFPIPVPDDLIDKTMFEDADYSWQLLIDDEFDTTLRVPGTSMSYQVHVRVVLDAGKVGDSVVTGDYEGTMNMEMSIDEESFRQAMESMDITITDMNFAAVVQTIDVKFTVVPYQIDQLNEAKYAYMPENTVPLVPLVQPQAMAITSAQTSVSGSIDIEAEEGYGAGMIGDNGNIPVVIEVRSDGTAVLYLPKILSMCDFNAFDGKLYKLRILDLP